MPPAAAAIGQQRSSSSPGVVAVPDHACPYCCSMLAPGAKKCRSCGEWVVRTSAGPAAALLRLLGWAWVALSLLVATGLWFAGSAVRTWLVARAVDPVVTPVVLQLLLYALVAGVVLPGLTVGVGLGVLAARAPRRPRWWG